MTQAHSPEGYENEKADWVAHTNDYLVIRSNKKVAHYAIMDIRTGREYGCYSSKIDAANAADKGML